MKTYPIVEITFSPTGGTKKVADQISCYLGNITNTVNLIRHDVYRGDTWFFYVYDPCSTDRYLCGMWNGWCLLCSYKQSDHISFDCSRVVWI